MSYDGFQRGYDHSAMIHPIQRLIVLPPQPENLNASGYDMVLTQAMYAIVGAIALEQGGATANKVSLERIIRPLQAIGAARKIELEDR